MNGSSLLQRPRHSNPQGMKVRLIGCATVYLLRDISLIVMAPDGAFGVGILEVEDEAEARQFGEKDPSVCAGLNRWELYSMRVTGYRGKS